jgi:hypothetical protein
MSELQIYLIVIGLVVILLVLGFNWFQDRRVRQRMQAQMPVIEQDPLLTETGAIGDARREPGLGGFSAGGINVSERISASEHPDALLDAQEPDASTEIVIEIAFQGPMLGEDLLPLVHPLRTAGRKVNYIPPLTPVSRMTPCILRCC